jgi:hypothetical protein
MKILQNIILILCLFLASCSGYDPEVCEDVVCTTEFRTITVKFVDEFGNPQIVKDYTAVNKLTGRSMTQMSNMFGSGTYVVASDSDLKELSEKGDIVLVSAINPKNNAKVSAEFVISGGLCICHIAKISGPESVKI